jgi:hypothetical protein
MIRKLLFSALWIMAANSHRSSVTTNLRGQQVDASYRGIVISNGRKFYQK